MFNRKRGSLSSPPIFFVAIGEPVFLDVFVNHLLLILRLVFTPFYITMTVGHIKFPPRNFVMKFCQPSVDERECPKTAVLLFLLFHDISITEHW